MHVPNASSLLFLAYLLVVLPWLAFRSAQQFQAARAGKAVRPAPSRKTIWAGTLFLQVVLLAFTWMTARTFGYAIFSIEAFRIRDVLAAGIVLTACFALRLIARATRSEDERRRMIVYAISPRTREERLIRNTTVLVTSVAEEAAYRGVGMAILWYALGNPWPAAIICSIAFALAHALQGWKSAAIIFCVALLLHGLVACTDTLIYAMLVHAIYDFAAGYWISRDAKRYDAGNPPPVEDPPLAA